MSIFCKIRHYHSFLRVCLSLNFKSDYRPLSLSTFRYEFNPLRKKILKKIESTEKTRVCVTILGNGAYGQPRCLGLFTNKKTFLFNCGEGVSRLLREYEYEADFHQIKHVFITHNDWANLSGLADIYISQDTRGVYKLDLSGPPGIEYFKYLVTSEIKSSRIGMKKIGIIDDLIEVNPICIHADQSSDNKRNDNDPTDIVFSYTIKINKLPAELVPEKLVEHNVPTGPHLLQLKNGEDVVLPCGRMIHAVDVVDSLREEEILLVVDCPSEQFLSPFVKNTDFSQYQLPSDMASKVSTLFHFSPSHIVNTKSYQDWMHNFHPKVQHVILNTSCSSIASESVYKLQSILYHLNRDIFKLLPNSKARSSVFISSSSVIYAPPMLQINYHPQKQFNWGNVVNYVPENYIQDAKLFPKFQEELKNLKSTMSSNLKFSQTNGNQSFPKVVFLGTCSAASSAYRNVSAILLNINSKTSILLDCGEGTFMQFARYFGAENVDMELCKISCIFISHLHTDHYMGLFTLLQKRQEAFKRAGCCYQRIALILPYSIRDIFKKFCEIYDPLKNMKGTNVYVCKYFTAEKKNFAKLRPYLGDIEVETVLVKHCYDSFGITVSKGNEWKIVYSGDTAPCQNLINAGENCTLLIHEASIEDDSVNEAMVRKHSTPSQVIDIAEKMNAQYTILTHFSKRYLAVPVFNNTNKNVGCAFDFMKVELHQLPLVPLFLPAIKCLFPEQTEKQAERTAYVVTFENSFMKNIKVNT